MKVTFLGPDPIHHQCWDVEQVPRSSELINYNGKIYLVTKVCWDYLNSPAGFGRTVEVFVSVEYA